MIKEPLWVPSEGVLRDHWEHGKWSTDAPRIFHVGSLLPVISACCADHVTITRDDGEWPLNVWIMLVGRSTGDRKSTAAGMAVNRLRDSKAGERILTLQGSPENFLKRLAVSPCALLFLNEGGELFTRMQASFWKHASMMLNELYDGGDKYANLTNASQTIVYRPRLSILSACATGYVEAHTNSTDWIGGLIARFLLLSGTAEAAYHSYRTDRIAEARMTARLNDLYLNAGSWPRLVIVPDSEADDLLNQWDEEIRANQKSDEFVSGMDAPLGRLVQNAVKLTGLYEIARLMASPPLGQQSVAVGGESAECAIALCRASRDIALASLAELTMARGPGRDLKHVENIIRRAGPDGIDRDKLIRDSHLRVSDLNQMTTTLIEGRQIRVENGERDTCYLHEEAINDEKRAALNMIELVNAKKPKGADKIKQLIAATGANGMSRTAFNRKGWSKADVDKVIDWLIDTKVIRADIEQTSGRPRTWYRLATIPPPSEDHPPPAELPVAMSEDHPPPITEEVDDDFEAEAEINVEIGDEPLIDEPPDDEPLIDEPPDDEPLIDAPPDDDDEEFAHAVGHGIDPEDLGWKRREAPIETEEVEDV